MDSLLELYNEQNILQNIEPIETYKGASLFWILKTKIGHGIYPCKCWYYIDSDVVLIITHQVSRFVNYSESFLTARLLFIDYHVEFTIDDDIVYLTSNTVSFLYSSLQSNGA